MRQSLHIVISGSLLLASMQLMAANEWKNPDLEKQTQPAQKTMPIKSPAAATAKKMPAARSLPIPKGQLALDVIRVCAYQKEYNDKGSGGKIDGTFYTPIIPEGYAMIGGYVQGNYHAPTDCVTAVKPKDEKSIALLQIPGSWKQLWTDSGSGAKKDGSIWQAKPQSSDYVCLGNVAQSGYGQPQLGNYVCVHQCLTEKTPGANRIWSTKGTGAKITAYLYKLHNSNSFTSRDHNKRPDLLLDLKGDTRCLF